MQIPVNLSFSTSLGLSSERKSKTLVLARKVMAKNGQKKDEKKFWLTSPIEIMKYENTNKEKNKFYKYHSKTFTKGNRG